ncbi:uncharacterized protein KNAG_0A02030 [Huiozyma naganishii CBS 8797]|uniref:Uncharacterized protein n=1 Tax=Huiozyma naganishii (strain ATCC MYA-139 / BCRC 22969 / CBS 8797 / KCTC 17520 / NBRC 10181 / NCYC 3082 / Yp74L-3) TaxID=1071383 RepID=J7RT58_HUIN7|nr:hypothetical protein KNAG_0A02030 [Kazachstania naganishii CBS 8797]CCK67892.1 hypothetical protein KNAG_0A02030 [Kazachstania naganishii CBS 8797]
MSLTQLALKGSTLNVVYLGIGFTLPFVLSARESINWKSTSHADMGVNRHSRNRYFPKMI